MFFSDDAMQRDPVEPARAHDHIVAVVDNVFA
jgi:hypothetical protein